MPSFRRTVPGIGTVLALIIVVASVAVWAARGCHTGWTRDTVFVETPDPITGLTKREPVERWIPGVDFLVRNGAVAAGVWVLALLAGRRRSDPRDSDAPS